MLSAMLSDLEEPRTSASMMGAQDGKYADVGRMTETDTPKIKVGHRTHGGHDRQRSPLSCAPRWSQMIDWATVSQNGLGRFPKT